jgi:glutathione synthase
MKVAFQMDPIGSVDIDADSTFRLAEEAQARGCTMWHYTPDGSVVPGGPVVARAQPLTRAAPPGRSRASG